jgi:hypothetical protein
MDIVTILKWLNLVEQIGGIINRCVEKLEEIRQPGFDPDAIDLAALKSELLGLPDLPEKP